ncbi:Helix-turn-helix domain protein [Candidatus Gugararchaeum adminiculabundum]|nr:Helix-turn-helix domain protein [Candidatus Gugararchaeum adminiculabundum]
MTGDKLSARIAGEIALSEAPGSTMKKWREIFGITQAELGNHLGISPSTISDYEGNRRKSPGIGIVRRFVDALTKIDEKKGGHILEKFTQEEEPNKFFELHEFAGGITGVDFAKMLGAKAIVNQELLESKKIYGYTLIDSIRVILEMPPNEFPKLYGSVGERAFIFTKVSTGRSPMVVIRVSPMKPSMVVLHGISEVDKLAIKIAQKEQIPLLVTKKDIGKIKEELNRI